MKSISNTKTNTSVQILLFLVPWESEFIPKPTPAQLKYQRNEIMALIHFNMGTFSKDGGSDPSCDKSNWNQRQGYAEGPTYVLYFSYMNY